MNKADSRGVRSGGAQRGPHGDRDGMAMDGRTLGEWLHGTIEEQAQGLGLPVRRPRPPADGNGRRRDDAPARYASSPARPAREPRALHERDPDDAARRGVQVDPVREPAVWERRMHERWARDAVRPDPRRERHLPSATRADVVSDAVEGGHLAARQAERRTEKRGMDETLASLAAMMQTSEERRAQEREAVDALARTMASLEAKITERMTSGESPIKGALARLEARLDIIGKRSEAENAVRHGIHAPEPDPDADGVRRLEGKLNTILDAIRFQPTAVSQVAVQAVQKAEPSPRRSLGDAIAEISRRRDALAHPPRAAFDDSMAGGAKGDGIDRSSPEPSLEARHEPVPRDAAPPIGASLRAPAAEFEGPPMRTVRPVLPTVAVRGEVQPKTNGDALDALDIDIRSISEKMEHLRSAKRSKADGVTADAAPTPAVRQAATDAALDKIERQLASLAGKVDEMLARKPQPVRLPAPKLDTSALEGLVHDLGAKIEAVRAPGADIAALDALQEQVERLSARYERSEQGLSILPTLAASVRELFDQLEGTRADVEASAAHAAREVLRIAAGDGRMHSKATAEGAAPQLAAMDGARSARALDAVHGILDGMVDRLSTLDRDQTAEAGEALRPAAQRPAALPPAPAVARDAVSPPLSTSRRSAPEPHKPDDLDEAAQRAHYIAAARRAATAARADPLVAPVRRPASASAQREARAGLLAKSRAYVAAHKRPLLMGVAAIVMVLGTLALLQQNGIGGARDIVAATPAARPEARAVVAQLAPPAPERVPAASRTGALSPSALPKPAAPLAAAIPGSDPIQTGSIPSLPAFAAASNPPRPMLPSGLKTAAEAGVGAAQYDLGARYADGRAVARDPKLAAFWLEKAAEQGLVPAQYRLASLYEKGVGIAQDKARARTLYIQAAEAGNARAMHNLAVLLADGDGHPDYAGAATWFRKAAGYGVHDSQYNLAVLLARGLGVQQSLTQSYQWFAIAASQDDADAARKRDEIGAKLGTNDLAIAKAFAAAFQPKPANPDASEVAPPPGGWNGAASASRVNSAKLSSL